MMRIARERISSLFALAEVEAAHDHPELADRYVALARRVGTRYNVRLLPEFRELYCRGCSVFWVEGRTVRTRLRSGRRVRTCLRCGRERRTSTRRRTRLAVRIPEVTGPGAPRRDEALAEDSVEEDSAPLSDDESQED
jgi:ribonuclease P protein subunit RPR2